MVCFIVQGEQCMFVLHEFPGVSLAVSPVYFFFSSKKKDVWYMKYIIDIKIHFEIYYITYMHPAKAPLSDNLLLIKLNSLYSISSILVTASNKVTR